MTTIANAKQSTPIAPTTNIDVNALRHRSDLITQISLESEIAPFPHGATGISLYYTGGNLPRREAAGKL
jgi:hypothetical protein